MAYSTAVHPKIYWYIESAFHFSRLESPVLQRCNRCLIQHLMTRASKYIDRCHRSIRTNMAYEITSPRPMLLSCGKRIQRS